MSSPPIDPSSIIRELALQNAQAVHDFRVPEEIQQSVVVFEDTEAPIIGFAPDAPLLMVMTKDVYCYESPDMHSPHAQPVPRGMLFERTDPKAEARGVEIVVHATYGEYEYDKRIYNAWIQVRNSQIEGWIFGAFLKTFQPQDRATMLRIRERYMNLGICHTYSNLISDLSDRSLAPPRAFTPEEQTALQTQRRFTRPLSPQDVLISTFYPDDFLSAYAKLERLPHPLLITCDFLLHMQHKFFNLLLVNLEKEFLIGGLSEMLEMALEEANKLRITCPPTLLPALDLASTIFAVAYTLLGHTPQADPSLHTIIAQELALIHSDTLVRLHTTQQIPSPGWMQPRGHYTQTQSLSDYFRSMSYLGLCRFNLKQSDSRQTLFWTRAAAVITLIWSGNAVLFDGYKKFHHLISTIFGQTDGLALAMFSQDDLNAITWDNISDDATILTWGEALQTKYKPEQISDSSGQYIFSFGLFSQRFHIDGQIIDSKNKQLNPTPPTCAWLLNALGSTTASTYLPQKIPPLLTQHANTWHTQPLPFNPNTSPQTNTQPSTALEKLTEEQWLESYYQGMLGAQRTIYQFPSRTGLPWLDTPTACAARLITVLASYAELKHDASLYNKPTYVGGGGSAGRRRPFDYIADPEPIPPCYIEPNLPLVVRLQSLCKYLVQCIQIDQLPIRWNERLMTISKQPRYSDRSRNAGRLAEGALDAIRWFGNDLKRCADIIRRVQWSSPYLPSDNEFLRSLPKQISSRLRDGVERSTNEELAMFRAAITSDIATYNPPDRNPPRTWALATGIPECVYMAVESPTEGKRVVMGVVYSVHEFYTWSHQPINDPEWRKLAYQSPPSPAFTETKIIL